MIIHKHARARFKQRLHVKNIYAMLRRANLAISRGTLLEDGSSKPKTLCYEYGGYKYIIAESDGSLITVFASKKPSLEKKGSLLSKLRLQETKVEANDGLLKE